MYVEIPRDWVSGRSTSTRGRLNVQSGPSNSAQHRRRARLWNKDNVTKRQSPEFHGSAVVRLFLKKKDILTLQNNLHKSPPSENSNFFFQKKTKQNKKQTNVGDKKKTKKNKTKLQKKELVDVDMTTSPKTTTLTERCPTFFYQSLYDRNKGHK